MRKKTRELGKYKENKEDKTKKSERKRWKRNKQEERVKMKNLEIENEEEN